MISNEPAYFAFIAVVAVVFALAPARSKPWWLALTGAVFYAYYSPDFVLTLLAETVAVFVLGAIIRRQGRWATPAFAAGLTLTLGMLAVYKYAGLLTSTVSSTGVTQLPSFQDVHLPLAISFFTFEFVHYLVDAKRGTLPRHRPGEFAAFALFVPTMIAGPIKRFQGFSPQVHTARAQAGDIHIGITRILTGLVKKVVVADTLTLWIAPLTSSDALLGSTRLDVVVALVAYSLHIYMDFSGYSDIAIGSARLLGIRVAENFDWPYLKTNIAEFWRSWHMSLMRWIRDYVYIPLGGSRRGLPRQVFNLIVAFAVSGIWHGAAWNFLAWGLYHGVLVAGYRVWTASIKPRFWRHEPAGQVAGERSWASRVTAVASGVLTFAFVTFGWALFAMPISRFIEMLDVLVNGGL